MNINHFAVQLNTTQGPETRLDYKKSHVIEKKHNNS